MKETIAKNTLIIKTDPESPAAEAYRALRTNLHFVDPDNPPKSIVVTSPMFGDGKSTVVSNLAICMAGIGKKVILVDVDLRKPKIHKYFNLAHKPGVTEFLLGEAPIARVMQKTDVSGLSIITSGHIPPNPAELLDSKKMADFVHQLEDQSDIVLFDSPPLLPVTDAEILASQIQGVLMVIDSKASKKVITQAKMILENGNAHLLGAVVNKVSQGIGGYYYHYHYHYYRYKSK